MRVPGSSFSTTVLLAFTLGASLCLVSCAREQTPRTATEPGSGSAHQSAPLEIEGVIDPSEPAPVQADQACIDCHGDRQRLLDTLAPDEVPPSESSGEG